MHPSTEPAALPSDRYLDDESTDARRQASADASDYGIPAGTRQTPAETLPQPHCIAFRVELTAEIDGPVSNSLILAREGEYTGHQAEPVRLFQAIECLVLCALREMGTGSMAGALTVTVGAPRLHGEVSRRASYYTEAARELGQTPPGLLHAPETLRIQISQAVNAACADYDALNAREFPTSIPA